MNEKQSITNYIYSKLQEAKKTSTEGKPAKTPKAKKPAKKPPTDPKPAAPPAPHWLDSPEHKARRQERALNIARRAHRSLRAEFKALSPEEQEKQEPEFEKQFQYWRDSLNEQQQYIADFVKNLLTEQRKKKPGGHTNAAGEMWTKRHIGRAVISGPPLVDGLRGSLEHIFDAHYDPYTGSVTNKHTGEKLPDHIKDLFDERNSHESHHVQSAAEEFPKPNWKDDEEPD